MLFCSAGLGEPRVTYGSEDSGDLSLRDASHGKPRSTNSRSFIPSNVDSRWKGSSGQGMKGGTQKQKTRKVHFVALIYIRHIQNYEYIPRNVRESNLKCGHKYKYKKRKVHFATLMDMNFYIGEDFLWSLAQTTWWLLRVWHPGSSDYRVCDRCVHTHSPVARTFFRTVLHTFTHLHACTFTHGSSVCKKVCCMRMWLISISPSPFSCFTLHPCSSLTVTSRPLSRLWRPRLPCRTVPDPKKRGSSALPHERRGVWLPGRSHAVHRLWAQRVRQDHFCGQWHDAHWRSRPQWNLWLLEKHTREHRTVRCSQSVWSLCFARFSWWFCSSERKQRKHASGNRCKTEREEREGSVISVAESMSRKSRRNSMRSHSLQTHREFFSDQRDLREHLEWKTQNLERRNSECALIESQRKLESQRLQFLEANQRADQAQREREYTLSKNLKNWKDAAMKRKTLKNNKERKKFLRNMIRNHAQWGLFFYDPELLSSYDVPTFLIKLFLPRVQESLAAKLECREIHERIWVFLETFWSSTCSTRPWWYNYSRNLATPSGIADDVEDSENSRNWEKWERRTIAINTFLLCLSARARRKKSRRWKVSCVFDSLPCRGYWDLYSKWHDNSQLSLLGDASEKFPDQTEFQSWIVNFQAGVCATAKNLALVLQWIKRSKQPARWRTSSIQNQLREKISRIMKNWIWWWRQNWNGATILFIWSTKLPSVEPWQDKSEKL